MQSLNEDIVADPAVQGGHPVLRGTRLPVYIIVGALAEGASLQDVCSEYSVTEHQVRAALAYAASSVQEERTFAVSG